eukprot:CAMPEP_0201920698 /NCGR_PEP_ID=MMETSP0903-20130614/9238_1 /ASSEMBLY_ACC=CAM_ASM_000552 /TAXON_ID=420261 /ORGANISM="Thalassiosira antarctica, Strain CCMP982" /LENGTH=568 /DNA_ID=CAMNT_0048457499 /DNA_START=51 /DNA_END=1757 /DNA_ORIENTATION=+
MIIWTKGLATVILLFLFDKTLSIMTALALVPSQVPGARHVVSKGDATTALHAHADTDSDSSAGDQVVYSPLPTTSSSTKKKNYKKKLSTPRTGNLPDIHWRAIPMSHLRSHPNFQPLPPPTMVNQLPTKEHVRNFRQESWQWDYLHTGRCTTSQTAAALGFLEGKAASYLGIPKSLRRGGGRAWERLTQVPEDDQSLAAMEQTLCEGRSALDNEEVVGRWRPGAKESERMWIPASRLRSPIRTKPFPFTAKYIPNLTHNELYERKLYLQQNPSSSPLQARMQWGNTQEATSVLTALNYFCGVDKKTTIHEVGMCGAAFDDEIVDPLLQGLKIGATPDAIICHGNGTVEVLEVKNHCPFVWNRISPHYAKTRKRNTNKKKKGKKQKKQTNDDDDDEPKDEHQEESGLPKHYLIRDFQLETRVPTAYIPQLMMEMLCVGDAVDLENSSKSKVSKPICTSAIMVRQTATKGAILLRLQRDEEWIQEMKYWLGKFQCNFVEKGKVPEDNFFWDDNPNSRYRKFLQRTIELSDNVEQVAFIDHGQIQRMVMERGFGGDSTVPLFLDRINKDEE